MTTERGIPCNTKAKAILEEAGLLDPNIVEANNVVMDTCAYSFDPNFENSALKERTGVYYEVFDRLSDGADPKEMAQYLICLLYTSRCV